MSVLSKITALICAALVAVFAPAVSYAARYPADSPETRNHFRSWGFPHREGVVLVLCGGGMKGLAHIGVFEVLEREKIPVAAVIGTSMGAIMGGLYSAGYTPAEMREILSKVDLMEIMSGRTAMESDKGAFNRPPAPNDALFSVTVNSDNQTQGRRAALNAKNLYAFLSELTADVTVTDFDYLKYPFAAVATNLLDGDTVVLRNGNLASALRASMSIPIVFDPWPMDDMLLVDGGLKANLPVLEAKKIYPGHPIVAVNLSPEDITKKDTEMRTMFDVAGQTLDILMIQQIRDNAAAADLVIAPDVKKFSTFESGGYDRIIDEGTKAAEAKIDDLHRLVEEKCGVWDHELELRRPLNPPIVAEVRFEGVPRGMAERIYKKYDEWIDKPLDMQAVSEAVSEISKYDDVRSVDGYTERLTRGFVAVVFRIERPAKYEIGFDGYASNLNANRWLSITGTARDTFMDGDTIGAEVRLGTTWGGMLRYFTPVSVNNDQWGLTLAARREEYEPFGRGETELERYVAKLAWYKTITDRMRIGVGYAGEMITSYRPNKDDEHGPYLSFAFNNLDDPVLPTRGFEVASDVWFPIGREVVSNTRFTSYIPIMKDNKVIFGGGFKTGDGDSLSYAAMLGIHNELYSLGQRPLVGDQAYWLHLGIERVFNRSWWGGVNIEIFGNYGQVLGGWDGDTSRWEAGVAFSVPTNNFNSKLIFVYDQEGGFTVGYSVGLPRFWDGPLP
ncbi:MAG TPA: patatin-like phospholipase family protein [Candidatus Caccocola faecipullorum]|nr:patatin-like phospholipase family protein [Candidatus Caccocola faecipullorum]